MGLAGEGYLLSAPEVTFLFFLLRELGWTGANALSLEMCGWWSRYFHQTSSNDLIEGEMVGCTGSLLSAPAYSNADFSLCQP